MRDVHGRPYCACPVCGEDCIDVSGEEALAPFFTCLGCEWASDARDLIVCRECLDAPVVNPDETCRACAAAEEAA